MHRLGPRLLLSQLGISALVSFILGFSTLSLARAYFLDGLEDALDVQAALVREGLFPSSINPDEQSLDTGAFNTLQQQIGNLSVEIQAVDPADRLIDSSLLGSNQKIQAFETIDLAVGFVTMQGERLLQPEQSNLPASFFPSDQRQISTPDYGVKVMSGETGSAWLVKAYPVTAQDQQLGLLILGQPLDPLQAVLEDLGWRIGGAALIALALALVISIVNTRGLLAPVQALILASEAIPSGNFDEPLPLDRKDELGELSKAFDAMRVKLEALEELRSRFISDVSHELRTPLTAIKGLAETLQDGAVDEPEVRDRFLALIERETDRLIRLTQDLLILTRIDAESFPLNLETTDFTQTIQDAIETLQPAIDGKEVKVDLNLPIEAVRMQADKDRLIQIIHNLLDNAIRYSPQRGEIAIELLVGSYEQPEFLALIDINLPHAGNMPRVDTLMANRAWGLLQIRDQGPGIEAPELSRIFERFYRSEVSRERDLGGAGLGLAIASALSKAHKSYLWLHSPPPGSNTQGTLVMFLFPLCSK